MMGLETRIRVGYGLGYARWDMGQYMDQDMGYDMYWDWDRNHSVDWDQDIHRICFSVWIGINEDCDVDRV